jgi:hypothetical protein
MVQQFLTCMPVIEPLETTPMASFLGAPLKPSTMLFLFTGTELKMVLITGWSKTPGDPTGVTVEPLRSAVEPMSAVLEDTAMQLSARGPVELSLTLQSLLHQHQSQLNRNVIFPSTGQV